MIGRLSGKLLNKQPPQLLIDVNGVGYEVDAPMSTFYQLPQTGENVVLHTHLVVREDAQLLFGFFTESERSLFRSLIRINGVGPRLGLTILSGISAEEFTRCVQEADSTSLTRLPGVGKKTAERLVVELRDRLPATIDADVIAPASGSRRTSSCIGDAVSALISLGYKAPEASRMVRVVENAQDMNTEEIIREALASNSRLPASSPNLPARRKVTT